MFDNTCRFLVENFSADFVTWLMGEAIPLTEIEPSELSLDPTTKSGLLKKLRQIQIDAPADFTSNLDQYLNQDYNAESALS
jgi:predicted transposase YdaD